MKTLIYVIIAFKFLLMSCDEEMQYSFIIENKSNSDIIIEYKAVDDGVDKTSTLSAETKDTIYTYSIIEGTKIYEREIKNIFSYITIRSNTSSSNKDYLSNETWDYTEKSNTYAIYYLTVDSTHFE